MSVKEMHPKNKIHQAEKLEGEIIVTMTFIEKPHSSLLYLRNSTKEIIYSVCTNF